MKNLNESQLSETDKIDKQISKFGIIFDPKHEPDWDLFIKQYGKSTGTIIENPLKVHKTLFSTVRKLTKPKEPMLMLQKKDQTTEFVEGVTQGVYSYIGSDGLEKKIWVNKKFLSTMKWGDDTVRYYNCTEDSFMPNGFIGTALEFEEVQKIIETNSLNHEKLKSGTIKAEGEKLKEIAKGIALIILAIGGVIVVANLFGIDILEYIFNKETAEQILTNTTETIKQNVTEVRIP